MDTGYGRLLLDVVGPTVLVYALQDVTLGETEIVLVRNPWGRAKAVLTADGDLLLSGISKDSQTAFFGELDG